MKSYFYKTCVKALMVASLMVQATVVSAQCNQNFIYGLTNVGNIQRITVSNGTVAAALNPAFTGNAANLSNALGYSQLNGKYYFFKRNTTTAPQEFVSFDPATNLYAALASAPVAAGSNVINLGCINSAGLGYYCLDAFGTLYYYSVSANTWTTICNNIKDQSGATLNSIIGAGSLNRFYGDMAFDGKGNLWIFISGASDYGLYKITGPLPTTATASMTATQVIAPNTPSPAGTFGGMAFSYDGSMYLASNSPSNKLYKLSSVTTLTYIADLSKDGIGNDSTSCNYPLTVLPSSWIKFTATNGTNNNANISFSILQPTNTNGYEVEYSTDGIKWDDVHFVNKNGDELPSTYNYTVSGLSGETQYFRIRETDYDGSTQYSSIQKLNIAAPVSISFWPNPVQTTLKVTRKGACNTTSQLMVFDLTGRELNSVLLTTRETTIAVDKWKPGTYIVEVKLVNGETISQKIVRE
ncbi:MAG: T9SS type A sorting domain-containing protein [Chitinophagaceae bacterium]